MTNASLTDRARDFQSDAIRISNDAARLSPPRPQTGSARRFWSALFSTLYVLAILAVLGMAFVLREEEYIIPKHGAGYWIGIAGGVIMLVLLLYPLRKKRAREAKYGSVSGWFKWHMVLGILGPTLIVLHSNFQLKSVNATVATVIMLTVVSSGIIGRFLYRKVHKGLHQTKAEVTALLFEADALYDAFGEDMQQAPEIMEQLKAFESKILQPHGNPMQSLALIVRIAVRSRISHHRVAAMARDALGARSQAEGWSKARYKQTMADVTDHLAEYYDTVRKAAELKFYSRLFGLWHVLHLPLFLLLIVAAIVHIVAVHLY